MSRFSFGTNGSDVSGREPQSPRRFRIMSALGLMVLMALGAGVLPAAAATEETEQAASAPWDEITRALVVGSTAFGLMIALACAVLYYTAKGHRQRHEGGVI